MMSEGAIYMQIIIHIHMYVCKLKFTIYWSCLLFVATTNIHTYLNPVSLGMNTIGFYCVTYDRFNFAYTIHTIF